MKRFRVIPFAVLAVLGAALLTAGVWFWHDARRSLQEEPPAVLYVLRDDGGMLARYAPDDETLLEVYPVYTYLLPERDIEQLRAGLPVYSEEELETRLEDFGL